MNIKELQEYKASLYGCRFCPMCKPAAEVANITENESHSTRGRALLLWRIAEGMADFGKRDVELLYQSTLDSISQAWCVTHYPVSEYILAARKEAIKRTLIPDPVAKALAHNFFVSDLPKTEVMLLAGEASEIGKESGEQAIQELSSLLEKIDTRMKICFAPSGTLPFVMGDIETSKKQAKNIITMIEKAGTKQVITDGPDTFWALKGIYPYLGLQLPDNIEVVTATEMLAKGSSDGTLGINEKKRSALGSVYFHDNRSTFFMADEWASDDVFQPGLSGSEASSGKGSIYELPRSLLDSAGCIRVSDVWARSLSRTSGADDGLWLTYPQLAESLAIEKFTHAQEIKADTIITDSPLSCWYLNTIKAKHKIRMEIIQIAEVFQ